MSGLGMDNEVRDQEEKLEHQLWRNKMQGWNIAASQNRGPQKCSCVNSCCLHPGVLGTVSRQVGIKQPSVGRIKTTGERWWHQAWQVNDNRGERTGRSVWSRSLLCAELERGPEEMNFTPSSLAARTWKQTGNTQSNLMTDMSRAKEKHKENQSHGERLSVTGKNKSDSVIDLFLFLCLVLLALHFLWKNVACSLKGGSPGGTSGKEFICQCRRQKRSRFDPWVGKIPWRMAWQPTPVFLPTESHGHRSLVGYTVHRVTKSRTQPKRLSTHV